MFIQVVDQAGSVVASSENYLDPNAFIYVYPEEGSHHRILVQRTVHGPPIAPEANFRVVVLTGQTPTGPANVIVATEMEQAEETVADLRRALAYGVPGVLALAGLLVWLLVGKALRPVELIRSQVASITDTASLDHRVGESPVDDEVGRLAQTMNAMLDRLQRSAERQRRFVADASHELRSPLASTRAQLEVALVAPRRRSVWEATAEDLLSENQRMERLVNDLLFLARTEERPAGLAGAAPLDLDDIVLSEAARLRARGRVSVDISRVSAGRVRGSGRPPDPGGAQPGGERRTPRRRAGAARTAPGQRQRAGPPDPAGRVGRRPRRTARAPGAHLRPLHPPRRRPQPARR